MTSVQGQYVLVSDAKLQMLQKSRNGSSTTQLSNLLSSGYIVESGGKYYVSVENAGSMATTDPDRYYLNGDGAIVKYKAPEGKQTTTTTTVHTTLDSILNFMGLSNHAGADIMLKNFLSDKKITVDNNGEITINAGTDIKVVIEEFNKEYSSLFVGDTVTATFTENSDQATIDTLVDSNVISQSYDGNYTVLDREALTNNLTTKVQDVTYSAGEPASKTLEVTRVTTTVSEVGQVTVPDNLRNDRNARRQLSYAARNEYARMVADAANNPEMRNAIDFYIAERKYSGKIEDRMNELLTYEVFGPDDQTKTFTRDGADIVQYYIDNYANEEDRGTLKNLVNSIAASPNFEDQKAIVEALQGAKLINNGNYSNLSDDLKRKGALLCMAKQCGLEPNMLLKFMATSDVMNARSTAQKLKDDEFFINQQTKDYVRNQQALQDIQDTTVYFSKDARKAGERADRGDPKSIHNDIGDKGRALVQYCPEMLCDEVPADQFDDTKDGYFKANINGQIKYFKFSSEKWQTFMGICCDPNNATDDAMRVLFGDDDDKRETFLKDLNLTLNEGRSVLDMQLPSPYGETGTLKFVEIIGNANGKIDNRELNALRDMVGSAGYSVDGNPTYVKRALHVLKQTGIGAGLGFLTGGLGSLLGGAVQFAGQTASQIVTLTGPVTVTGTASLGYTDQVITSDTNTTNINGEIFTNTTTHVTDVTGTTTGEVTLTDKNASITGEVEGQHYSGDVDPNHFDAASKGGILGGIGGAVQGMFTMGGVNAKGRSVDDIFDFTKTVEETESLNQTLSIEITPYTATEIRKVERGVDVEALPAVKWQGPAAYSILYQMPDGSAVDYRAFAAAYQKQVDGLMTNKNFYAYPTLTLADGTQISLRKDYKEKYSTIPIGTSGVVAGVDHNPSRRVSVQATIVTK